MEETLVSDFTDYLRVCYTSLCQLCELLGVKPYLGNTEVCFSRKLVQ